MRFKDFILQEQLQISRSSFYEILRWAQALAMNYGTNARPGTDITKGDFGVQTNDPQRLIRIFQWALGELRKIENQLGGQLTPNRQDVAAGKYDQLIVPILKQLSHLIRSVQVNFQQVGYSHPNTDKMVQMLAPYAHLP